MEKKEIKKLLKSKPSGGSDEAKTPKKKPVSDDVEFPDLESKLKSEYKAVSSLATTMMEKQIRIPEGYQPKPILCMNCELYFWSKRQDRNNSLFSYVGGSNEYKKIDFSGVVKRDSPVKHSVLIYISHTLEEQCARDYQWT